MKFSRSGRFLVFCSFLLHSGLAPGESAQVVKPGSGRSVEVTGNKAFPDYDQPTTRYVTSGENLRRSRKFNLGEQMDRESMGFTGR
jgi:hypothetical protein